MKIILFLFLFLLSAGDLLFAPTKNKQKIGAGTFGQQLVIRQFLKIVAVVIRKLIALTPKITHQQRKMICAILRQFFQNFETICNPSLYGVLARGKLCAPLWHILSHEKTSLWRRFRKCMRKCSNCAVKPHASFPSAGVRF